ncbi:MAG: hypothetical protein KA368_14055 [Acidobacteria bacterium]|nr:hypothetical protein [Acidobacteriota bacterium]
MTPEQMENAMNFIVEQQAKFSVDMDLLKERHEQRMKDIDAVQAVHQEVLEQLTEASVNAFKIIAELGKAQKQTDKQMAATDERLNILINVVENHISNHNGKH